MTHKPTYHLVDNYSISMVELMCSMIISYPGIDEIICSFLTCKHTNIFSFFLELIYIYIYIFFFFICH